MRRAAALLAALALLLLPGCGQSGAGWEGPGECYAAEVPELPGSYFTSRCMDNAFRDVLYNNRNPRAALEKENDTINREILRKREELGY